MSVLWLPLHCYIFLFERIVVGEFLISTLHSTITRTSLKCYIWCFRVRGRIKRNYLLSTHHWKQEQVRPKNIETIRPNASLPYVHLQIGFSASFVFCIPLSSNCLMISLRVQPSRLARVSNSAIVLSERFNRTGLKGSWNLVWLIRDPLVC